MKEGERNNNSRGVAAMRLKSKITAILKDTSGVSLMLVLGIMMLLMAVGASVMAAASSNIGANIRQNQYNRAVVLADSVHRNIRYSLLTINTDGSFPDNSLALELMMAIFNEGDSLTGNDPLPEYEIDINVTGDAAGGGGLVNLSALRSVTLTFPFINVINSDPAIGIPELDIEPVPGRVSASARMVVTVVIGLETVGILDDIRLITTRAIYEYSGGIKTETTPPYGDGAMVITDYGRWELVGYEIVDSFEGED